MHNQDIPFEDVGDVVEQVVVNLDIHGFRGLLDVLNCLSIDVEFDIVVLVFVKAARPDVQLRLGVPGSWQIFLALRVALLGRSTVHTAGDNVPAGIPVGQFALVERCGSRKGKENWTDDMHLIVDVASVIQILGRKGTL